ncbi:TetR/AcrR family transcriptional regulator [Thermophagus xiamenensis]|uniref:Transcriptional regulator, TetR family n=1 Tax=Thermophagus xiamenensis TaxID=385682 RepID=A0A1I1YAL9_9BACT|nr:TetR/AcrR family transcriptional regulator [Thermophagus xiamenensis]SFE16048.1 transcriptional regulator, TetR family [Thermophagus xiamenensis]
MSSIFNSFISGQDTVRNLILRSARDLFAQYGYRKTTMEDIAVALRKGKSSLYYYFKNKEEIFQAVIELESEILENRLWEVVKSEYPPKQKFNDYVIIRMETLRELKNFQRAMRDESYRSYLFLDEIREKSEVSEKQMLKTILEEGVSAGQFDIKNLRLAAIGISTALRGLELPLLRGIDNFDDFRLQLDNILNILFYGILKR